MTRARSITTSPADSKAAMERVKSERRGQYATHFSLTSGFVEVDGVRIHYVAGGSGPPIIFIHGFGSTWKMWEPALKHFASTHHAIALDLPGLGQSAPSEKGYGSDAIGDYILGAVRKLTDQPIVYVCHDLGNSTSYPLIADNQGYITKTVFMDSPIPSRDIWTYPGLTPTGPGLGWHFGFFTFGDIAEKLIAHDPMLFFDYFIKSYAGKKAVFTEDLLYELVEPYCRIQNLHAAFSGYYSSHSDDARRNEGLLAQGKRLHIPSRSISGAKGVNDVLPKLMAERFVEPGSDFAATIIPECGHWLLEESAPDVIRLLTHFIVG